MTISSSPYGPRYVLLDWDNTLHDSAGTNFAALARVLADYGLEVTAERYRQAYTVDHRALYRSLGLAPERIAEASDRWREIVARAEPRLLPGAREALLRLQADGRRLGLVTAGPRVVVEAQLERLDLTGLFATTVFGDDQPARPDPRPLRDALAALGGEAIDAAFCSDTAADMRMAAAAGVAGIGIASFVFTDAELCAAGASSTAASVADWVACRSTPCAAGATP